jgi:hypothetical protein
LELLSYVSQVAKRKARFTERAEDLATEFPSVEKLEGEMQNVTEGLVYRLKTDRMRFTEFQRVVADDTITSALAGVMLGDDKKTNLTDTTFATATKALPYLWKFYNDIDSALRSGRLVKEIPEEATNMAPPKSPSKYAKKEQTSLVNDDLYQDMLDEMPNRLMNGEVTGAAIPATWNGVQSRTARYLVTPVYGWHAYGEMGRKQRTGFKQMRRRSQQDKRCCEDCTRYDSQGWTAIGALPPPGQNCRCLDNCRCFIEYR